MGTYSERPILNYIAMREGGGSLIVLRRSMTRLPRDVNHQDLHAVALVTTGNFVRRPGHRERWLNRRQLSSG